MSTPRDPHGFDDRPDDGSGWHEPAHLEGASAADGGQPTESGQPTGDVQPAESARPAPGRPAPREGAGGGGLLGAGRWRARGDVAKVFAYEGDLVGAQGWALQRGWTISDGTGPQDAVLTDLLRSAPVRPTKEHIPAGVLRGRAGTLELVAFDVVYPDGRRWVPEWAVTAAPLLVPVPGFRLSPARFWKHRTAGLIPMASGNEAFDARWLLLGAEDSPQLRGVVQDPTVQGLLLGSDDGDEFWSAAGHVAALRPDGHRPLLIEHHIRLLTAIVAALTAGY
jgi:hypothetical protein